MWTFRTGTHDFLCAFIDKHNAPIQSSFTRVKERPVWLFLARGLKVFLLLFVCTYGHARMATHVRARESEGTAWVVVVSGTVWRFFFFFALTATHIQARTYGHAPTGTHLRTYTRTNTRQCVSVCVCLLSNSKTIKPSSLKLCVHPNKTPRKCKSENWVFGLIKTPLLKIINGLI